MVVDRCDKYIATLETARQVGISIKTIKLMNKTYCICWLTLPYDPDDKAGEITTSYLTIISPVCLPRSPFILLPSIMIEYAPGLSAEKKDTVALPSLLVTISGSQ